ncbi:MAG: amidohydrolase [Gammaproteobacteria bacterium]
MIVDTHLHSRSSGAAPFPVLPGAPPEGASGETAEALLATLAACGVGGAVLVQWNSRHGYDNAYAADAIRRHPGRFAGVCSIDTGAADAADRAAHWITAGGMRGVRLFNGFALSPGDRPLRVDDARVRGVVDRCQALGVPLTVMSAAADLDAVASLARDRPALPLLLDHLALADDASRLLPLAALPNVALKFSTGVLAVRHDGSRASAGFAAERALIERLLEGFGARRLLWGSNYPQTPLPYRQIVELADVLLATQDASTRALVMGGNALRYWPEIADWTAHAS